MITPLKAGICAYLTAMALVADAEAQQGEHIPKGEKVINGLTMSALKPQEDT